MGDKNPQLIVGSITPFSNQQSTRVECSHCLGAEKNRQPFSYPEVATEAEQGVGHQHIPSKPFWQRAIRLHGLRKTKAKKIEIQRPNKKHHHHHHHQQQQQQQRRRWPRQRPRRRQRQRQSSFGTGHNVEQCICRESELGAPEIWWLLFKDSVDWLCWKFTGNRLVSPKKRCPADFHLNRFWKRRFLWWFGV